MAELYILDQDDRLLTVITEETGLIEAPFREELNRISNQPSHLLLKQTGKKRLI
ncbi:hypothetical protein [Halalkalibacter hemicellulosilyticus]|uniref:Uncharacterized protein n=1 Tax=Halalkalibacter hemicellulosilyticusJCM 9152 TaxID=1236971 RepID=W4QIN1_9BACI|nr:hypothetical protein [Halalkalibacter hemicellulosilyticus]GAE31926.1 hypothetical protein JCM9152_3426 [Halalkalibacter hemicellulosilyticusJCM 9152]